MRERAIQILEDTNAVLTGGHFVYTSGRHGSVYVNKDAVYPHTEMVSQLCTMFADELRPHAPEVVCGPALGGIILSQWTAHHLGVLGVYAEKSDSGLELRRNYDKLVAGRRVGVVEDIVTTGGSLKQAVEAVRLAGGEVVGAVAIVNRGGIDAADLGTPVFSSLVELDADSYDPSECPLCADGVPVNTDVGKGSREDPPADTVAGESRSPRHGE